MPEIKVLIADDSVLARDLIKAILSSDGQIVIVGEAKNGAEAIAMAAVLKPDIITMDIEMPVMNGLDAIEQIMANNARPILVVTSLGDAHTAYSAISRGALDLIEKPDVNLQVAAEFISKVKLLARVQVLTHLKGRHLKADKQPSPPPDIAAVRADAAPQSDKVVAIASSTGGPDALSVIISSLPETFPCPILISQHISDGFVPGMVDWFRKLTRLQVQMGANGAELRPGHAYVSPSEMHMTVGGDGRIALVERQPSDIFRPSCDRLLLSVADVFGSRSLGVILTGMGNDGVYGMQKIKQAGGITVAQDERTSVVFGMPRVAIETGCIDRVLPIQEIGRTLIEIVSAQSGQRTA